MGDGSVPFSSIMQHHSSQQQLAALLAAALPPSPDGSATPPDDISRVAALSSLHHTILHPHSLFLLHHSSSYLCQALLQLLSDESYNVRQEAALAYGALGAVTASAQSSANGRSNVSLPGSPADRFLGWALPLLSDVNSNSEAAELALVGLHEFLTTGETDATERYIPSILGACQALLEDEGTSLSLLRPLLGILTELANRFTHIFQPHFADLVDLLLGWALMPDLPEPDLCLITGSFLQFQNFWVANLPFSFNLLSKFLGDMDALGHDAAPGTSNQLRRLLALASCFVAVLQAATSGILELGIIEETLESLHKLLPLLLTCLGRVGKKFRTFKWLKEASTCLSLFASLLRERFADFSYLATEFFLRSIGLDDIQDTLLRGTEVISAARPGFSVLASTQVQVLLKVNLEILSWQGSALPSSVISRLLEAGSSFSSLRLHASHAVTGVVSATYLLLLRHASEQVVGKAIDCLIDELSQLKGCLHMKCRKGDPHSQIVSVPDESKERSKLWNMGLSELDVRELMKFDIMALTCSACLDDRAGSWQEDSIRTSRVKTIRKFLLRKLNPFENPLQYYADIQFGIIQSMHRLFSLDVTERLSKAPDDRLKGAPIEGSRMGEGFLRSAIIDCLHNCTHILVKALDVSASFPVKMEALDWLGTMSNLMTSAYDKSFVSVDLDSAMQDSFYKVGFAQVDFGLSRDLVRLLLTVAVDREQKVRGRVAMVMELLARARFIPSIYLHDVADVALEQLGDPDPVVQSAFRRVLSLIAPVSLWTIGWNGNMSTNGRSIVIAATLRKHWKQEFALRQFSKHLRSQQLVFILNFIAQRWQVLPFSWLQRLIHNFPGNLRSSSKIMGKGGLPIQEAASANSSKVGLSSTALGPDFEYLAQVCDSNNLASAWWAIHEAARHCITLRLRTHLGGPTQTFAVLERMLLDIVQSLQADSSQRETGSGIVMPNVQLLPMRLLLEFVEALKKNIFNAHEGSVVLATPPPASAQFFHANRKVCEDWFARICEALMHASLALQCHAAAFHHAVSRLQDLRGIAASALREVPWSQMADRTPAGLKAKVHQQDVRRTLCCASLALCRAHEADTILGLRTWATSAFGALLSDDPVSLQKASNVLGPLGWMNGLALQAQGQYEKAAEYFSLLLQSDEALGVLGADGVQFIIARMIESYVAVADWEALELWLQELQALRARHAGKAYAGALTTAGHDMNAIHALACFDAGDTQGAWGHLDLTPQSSGDLTPDPRQALQRSEQMLLQAQLRSEVGSNENVVKEIEKAKNMLKEALLVAGFDGLSQAAPLVMQLHCIDAFEAKQNAAGMKEDSALLNLAWSNPLEQVACFLLDAIHQDCGLWLKLLRVYKAINPESAVTFWLQRQLIRLARKQCNFRFTHRLLKQVYRTYLQDGSASYFRDSLMWFDYEHILVLYAKGEHQEAITALWSLVQGYITSPTTVSDHKHVIRAKACLKLSSWLKQKPTLSNYFLSKLRVDNMDELGVGALFPEEDGMARDTNQLPLHSFEEVIGAAIKSATLLCPNMDKAWFLYAMWCYDLGNLLFSGSNALKHPSLFPHVLNSEFPPNGSVFSKKEVDAIRLIILEAVQCIGDQMTANFMDSWKDTGLQMRAASYEAFVQRTVYLMQMAAGAVGGEESDGESPSGMLSMQLRQELLVVGRSISPSHATIYVNKLMEIWWILRKRKVSLYEHAVQGFLKYLSLSNWKDHGQTIDNGAGMRRLRQQREDHVLSSSLHVLHILFNHGVELEDTIQGGLSSVPPMPWQEVTTQIYARLSSHPESQVRKQLESLLMTLAKLSPWAIVYPTLVNLKTSDGEPSAELQKLLGCLACCACICEVLPFTICFLKK